MESACGIQINNCINFTSGTACQHSGAPHRSKWNGCTAYAEQLSRFTVTCTIECRKAVPDLRRIYRDNIPQDFQTPCILVTSVKTEVSRSLGDVQRIKEIFDVLYFPDGEIQNAWKQCETVKQGMLRCFDVIKADGISFYFIGKTAVGVLLN